MADPTSRTGEAPQTPPGQPHTQGESSRQQQPAPQPPPQAQFGPGILQNDALIAALNNIAQAMRQQAPAAPQPAARQDQLYGWKITNIGYFHPDVAGKNDVGQTELNGRVVFKDIHLFLDSVRNNCDSALKIDIIRRGMSSLLRGSAQTWYIAQITEEDRRWLNESLEHWRLALLDRFKMPQTEAAKKLTECEYTAEDCRAGKDIRDYAMQKIRYARDFGVEQDLQLLTYVYMGIYPNLRQLIRQPNSTSTIGAYLTDIEDVARSHSLALRQDQPSSSWGRDLLKEDQARQASVTTHHALMTTLTHLQEQLSSGSLAQDLGDAYYGGNRRDDRRDAPPRDQARGGGRGRGNYRDGNRQGQQDRYPDRYRPRWENRGDRFRGRGRRFGGFRMRGNKRYRYYPRDGRRFRRWVRPNNRGPTYLADEELVDQDDPHRDTIEHDLVEEGYVLADEFEEDAHSEYISDDDNTNSLEQDNTTTDMVYHLNQKPVKPAKGQSRWKQPPSKPSEKTPDKATAAGPSNDRSEPSADKHDDQPRRPWSCRKCRERFQQYVQLIRHLSAGQCSGYKPSQSKGATSPRNRHTDRPRVTFDLPEASSSLQEPLSRQEVAQPPVEAAYNATLTTGMVIEARPSPDREVDHLHRSSYLKFAVKPSPEGKLRQVCGDTGSSLALAERQWVVDNFPDAVFSSCPPRAVSGVNSRTKVDEMVNFSVIVPGIVNGVEVFGKFEVSSLVIPMRTSPQS